MTTGSSATLALACLLLLAGAGSPSHAQPAASAIEAPARSIALAKAVRLIAQRWHGDVLSAEVVRGRPDEKTDFVWSVRLLSEAGALVVVRLDAQSGAYLGARGVGLAEARRLPAGN